jgi:hypothetical protein
MGGSGILGGIIGTTIAPGMGTAARAGLGSMPEEGTAPDFIESIGIIKIYNLPGKKFRELSDSFQG